MTKYTLPLKKSKVFALKQLRLAIRIGSHSLNCGNCDGGLIPERSEKQIKDPAWILGAAGAKTRAWAKRTILWLVSFLPHHKGGQGVRG